MKTWTGDFDITPLRIRLELAEAELHQIHARLAYAVDVAVRQIASEFGLPLERLAEVIQTELRLRVEQETEQ